MNTSFLFIEINHSKFIFSVGNKDEENKIKIIYSQSDPIQGIENFKFTDLELVLKLIKKNILVIEQKLNFIFKEVILIINNFNCSFINLTGYNKLNGSQVLKENITYILNSLKSNIDNTEKKKKIIHIFNSKYFLDNKKMENLPIGLFGEFYSHELSFCLIDKNDFNNLNYIFNKCNLKIKKLFFKSFVECSYLSKIENIKDTFYLVEIKDNFSQIYFFENGSLRLEQRFNFGLDLVQRDISKITSLKKETIEKIILNNAIKKTFSEDEFLEKHYFENENYIKIKKKLLFQITEARIEELLNIILIENINLKNFEKKNNLVFIKIESKPQKNCFEDIFRYFLSRNHSMDLKFIENIPNDSILDNVYKLVHFGWKREAIPVTSTRKSLIARFFEMLFN